ncbi:MAG: ABC transporter ATP-binding protein, partial [Thermoflexales bacterium]|nr:ABC transporter ATP-binding protein [Thermoflexales bacterium]
MTAVIEEFEEALDDEAQERPFNYGYFRRLVKYLRPYQRSLLIVLAFILVGTVATLLEPYLIALIIDQGVANKDYGLVLGIVGLLVAFRVLAWAAQYLRMFRVNTIGQAVLYDMRNQLFTHIQKLSLRFYDSRPVGKIMSRVTSDVGAINELINGGMATIIAEGLSLVGIVVILFLINWKLALIAYLITPSFYFIFGKLRSRIEKAWTNVRKSQANMNANLNESVSGVRVTQAFVREERNITRFERINRWNRDANVKAIRLDNLIWPIVEMVGMFGTAMLVYFGASEVIAGALSIGVILAFINYLWRFWGPVSALSRVYSQVLAAMASAERIFEFLDTEPEVA